MKRLRRVLTLSLEGVSAETLILSVGLALVLGVFPVYGCPTLLCAAAAIVLRLNLPAMQLVNLLTAPLQFALLIPFHRLGARLIALPTHRYGSWPGVGFLTGVWTLAIHAIAGWSCICVPLAILLYLTMSVSRRLRLGSFSGVLAKSANAPVLGKTKAWRVEKAAWKAAAARSGYPTR